MVSRQAHNLLEGMTRLYSVSLCAFLSSSYLPFLNSSGGLHSGGGYWMSDDPHVAETVQAGFKGEIQPSEIILLPRVRLGLISRNTPPASSVGSHQSKT